MSKRPEILAPAGSMEALEAAVRCGADAVYLGQKSFSARASSRNFDREELQTAVRYAHRFGVKIHQALNILVFDREYEALRECIRAACEAGVDALIVQDWGVASVVRELAPEMPLHASTQMAVCSPAGVRAAEELGFSRVVLARELSKEEIAAIRHSTSLEIETFVHGAHCMCMSGQCYMSAFFGGKSGNRGQCAQPCRLPFTAGCPGVKSAGESVLSLKDMSLVERLPELAAMGIDSFKIEGRMKRPEYVAAAVAACRKALDGETPDLETLRAVFSRSGFTSAYFDDKLTKEMFGFRRREDVQAAAPVLKSLAGLYHKDVQRVPVRMELLLEPEKPVRFTLSDGEFLAAVEGEVPREAVSAPVDRQTAEKFLSKLGGTPYYPAEFRAEIAPGLTLPASAFNAVRREAVQKLDALRENRAVPFLEKDLPASFVLRENRVSPQKWGKFESAEQLPDRWEQKLDRVLLSLPELEQHPALWADCPQKFTAVLPRFLFDREEDFLARLVKLRESGIGSVFCENIGHITLAKEAGMEPFGGAPLNIAGSAAAVSAAKLGLKAIVSSAEQKLDDARRMDCPIPMGGVVYGRLPLMSVRSCPVKAQIGCARCRRQGFLTDRKGISFPVRCDFDKSVSFIYNSVPVVLSDRLPEIRFWDFWLFDFSLDSKEEAAAVLERYRAGLKPEGAYTRGLYYRGVE